MRSSLAAHWGAVNLNPKPFDAGRTAVDEPKNDDGRKVAVFLVTAVVLTLMMRYLGAEWPVAVGIGVIGMATALFGPKN